MSRSLRRGAVAAVIVAIAPVLAACSAGSSAATLEVKPNSAATSVSVAGGQLKLNGVAIVTDATGNAPASVIASIANNETQDENLVSVTVGTTGAQLSGPTTIKQGSALSLGTPGANATTAIVPTLDQPAGANEPVTFVFANGGSITLNAQIQTGTGDYASYAPATPTPTQAPAQPQASGQPGQNGQNGQNGQPNPAASASPKETKKAKASESPSPTPTH